MTRILVRLTFLILLLSFLPASAPSAGEAIVYAVPQIFASRLTGDAQVSANGSPEGTSFDLQDTLGLDQDVNTPGIEGFARILLVGHISFSHFRSQADGSARLDDPLEFNGETFAAGERVDTEIEMSRYKLLFGYNLGLKVVNIGFLGGAHLVDLDARMEGAGHEEQEDLRLPVPAVGVSIGIHPLKWLALHGELSGFSVTVSGFRTRLLDGYAGVDFLLASKVGLGLGYRYFLLEAEDDDEGDSVDLAQRGAYAGLSLHL
jgi:hypothetical protein